MNELIVATGRTGRKFVNDETKETDVTPFVIGQSKGRFGIGLFVVRADGTKQAWTWGPIWPRYLIRAWRAMKLLEEMPRIYINSAPSCLNLAEEESCGDDGSSIGFGGYEEFREVRAKVLALFPTEDQLERMLSVCDKHHLDISLEEIEEQRSKLSTAEEVLERICAADDARNKIWRETEQTEIPGPAAPSIWKCFRRLFKD